MTETDALLARTVINPLAPHDLGGDHPISNKPGRARGGVGARPRLQRLTTGRAQRAEPDGHILSLDVVSCD